MGEVVTCYGDVALPHRPRHAVIDSLHLLVFCQTLRAVRYCKKGGTCVWSFGAAPDSTRGFLDGEMSSSGLQSSVLTLFLSVLKTVFVL